MEVEILNLLFLKLELKKRSESEKYNQSFQIRMKISFQKLSMEKETF
jgi:hypothetical protein